MAIQRVGWRSFVPSVVNAVDADATAFISAAGITNLTQAAAINTLVNDLKTYGLWTKMKAIYPFVGGTSVSHKFNLKDPRDLDAAYRLIFFGGWTHTPTGALPNGTNAYSDTFFIPSTNLSATSVHLSYYSRTNRAYRNSIAIGAWQDSPTHNNVDLRLNGNNAVGTGYSVSSMYDGWDGLDYASYATSRSDYFLIGSKTAINLNKVYENGVLKATSTVTSTRTIPNCKVFIGAESKGTTGYTNADNLESAFASIGDGLTDIEAANFYTAVQKFQTTLGRQIGVPIVSDSDAQAFLNAAGITDLGQANAVNTLVTDLKTAGIWTKMKAIYPFVGGTATAHKFNLKDPRDLDAAYRLVFSGGWVHSSTGAKPNGTTGYADTKLAPNVMPQNSVHASFYSRTDIIGNYWDVGAYAAGGGIVIGPKYQFGSSYVYMNTQSNDNAIDNNPTVGLYMGNRTSSTTNKLYRNGVVIVNGTKTSSTPISLNIYLGADNEGTVVGCSPREQAFASIGDGLTDAEATNFYTAVQKFQTTLGRQIGTPVLDSGQTAGLLDTYSSAAVAYSLRKLRTGYYGYAIRVRRSSDNTEQDISFKSDGTLDTTSLLAFVGNGNGFVTTWYDQSGNGFNAYQSTAINQPSIVINGSLTTNGGKPAIRCAGSTGLLINQISLGTTHSMFVVIDWSATNKEYLGSFGNSWAFYQVDGEYKASGAVGRTNASFTTNRFLGTLLRVNTQLQYYQNSATLGSPFSITANNSFNLSNLIGEDYNWGFAGDQQETIIYTSSMASSRSDIESNINSYYSIY